MAVNYSAIDGDIKERARTEANIIAFNSLVDSYKERFKDAYYKKHFIIKAKDVASELSNKENGPNYKEFVLDDFMQNILPHLIYQEREKEGLIQKIAERLLDSEKGINPMERPVFESVKAAVLNSSGISAGNLKNILDFANGERSSMYDEPKKSVTDIKSEVTSVSADELAGIKKEIQREAAGKGYQFKQQTEEQIRDASVMASVTTGMGGQSDIQTDETAIVKISAEELSAVKNENGINKVTEKGENPETIKKEKPDTLAKENQDAVQAEDSATIRPARIAAAVNVMAVPVFEKEEEIPFTKQKIGKVEKQQGTKLSQIIREKINVISKLSKMETEHKNKIEADKKTYIPVNKKFLRKENDDAVNDIVESGQARPAGALSEGTATKISLQEINAAKEEVAHPTVKSAHVSSAGGGLVAKLSPQEIQAAKEGLAQMNGDDYIPVKNEEQIPENPQAGSFYENPQAEPEVAGEELYTEEVSGDEVYADTAWAAEPDFTPEEQLQEPDMPEPDMPEPIQENESLQEQEFVSGSQEGMNYAAYEPTHNTSSYSYGFDWSLNNQDDASETTGYYSQPKTNNSETEQLSPIELRARELKQRKNQAEEDERDKEDKVVKPTNLSQEEIRKAFLGEYYSE